MTGAPAFTVVPVPVRIPPPPVRPKRPTIH
jgi:hypothetical protein